MPSSNRTNVEVASEVERLSSQIASLQTQIAHLPVKRITPEVLPPKIARMRVSLDRACKGFRRLGNGSFALAGFILVAFLTALFAGQLTLLPAFIGGTGALFLVLAGYVFHIQADSVDIRGFDDD